MTESNNVTPLVGVIMGSRSDWETMQNAVQILDDFQVPYEARVVSAHRTPEWMAEYADYSLRSRAESHYRRSGWRGAPAWHGWRRKPYYPCLAVPVQSKALQGLDSLLSIVQMPGGVPVGTMAIGTAGAKNAALLACTDSCNE